jgi:hypothetical protein
MKRNSVLLYLLISISFLIGSISSAEELKRHKSMTFPMGTKFIIFSSLRPSNYQFSQTYDQRTL